MALAKSSNGDYNYQFHFVDEKGHYCGFNDVWAPNKKEAIRLARLMESPARDSQWGRLKGLYVDVKSLKKATWEKITSMNILGNMMTM
jgi:hypothetical protein